MFVFECLCCSVGVVCLGVVLVFEGVLVFVVGVV